MDYRKWVIYFGIYLIPSSTAIYIILHDYLEWGMLVSYIMGSLGAGLMYLPMNKYIFTEKRL